MATYFGDSMDIQIGKGMEFTSLEEAMVITNCSVDSASAKFSDDETTIEDISFAEETMQLIRMEFN